MRHQALAAPNCGKAAAPPKSAQTRRHVGTKSTEEEIARLETATAKSRLNLEHAPKNPNEWNLRFLGPGKSDKFALKRLDAFRSIRGELATKDVGAKIQSELCKK